MAGDEWESLTNGKEAPNGTGLTSGPGLVNGLGYTEQVEEAGRRPEGHLFLAEMSQVDGYEWHRGLGVRRDLINGLSTPQTTGPKDPHKGIGPLARRRWARRDRLEELAEGRMPGEVE
jgi:hypothetical protein